MQIEFDKEAYKYYKADAKEDGVFLATRLTLFRHYSGLTVAFVPATPGPDCRMLNVAVSYCAPEDDFKKKIGKFQTLIKLYGGEFVTLPLAEFLRQVGEEETAEFLLSTFEV